MIVLLLIGPSVLTALTSTDINLLVCLTTIVVGLALAKKLPNVRYIFIVLASLVLAFPPFPLWLKSDGAGGMRIEWTQEIINRAPLFHAGFFLWNLLLVIFLFEMFAAPQAPLVTERTN
jgi:hypothetical protein